MRDFIEIMKQKVAKAVVKSESKKPESLKNKSGSAVSNKMGEKQKNLSVSLKASPKKNKKVPKKSLAPAKAVVEVDSSGEEDSGDDVKANVSVASGPVKEESDDSQSGDVDTETATFNDESSDEEQGSDEEEGNDEEQSSDEEEQDSEEQSSDENPDDDDYDEYQFIQSPTKKKHDPKSGIPKIKFGQIPPDYPNEKIVFVRNLPAKGKFKPIDVIEEFGKYGTLVIIKFIYSPDGSKSSAFLAYDNEAEAEAALSANGAKIKNCVITVCMKRADKREKAKEGKNNSREAQKKQWESKKDRILYVTNLTKDVNEEDLKEHFADCGDIEEINIINARRTFRYAFITFADADAAKEGIKLNNSTLKGSDIGVYFRGAEMNRDPKRTACLRNTQGFKTFPVEKLASIFKKCGPIENIELICRSVLAFIKFQSEDGLKEALKLNGKTKGELEIDITEYRKSEKKPNTSIVMLNVKPGVTEEDIREFFANTGEIHTIFLSKFFAIITFKDTDGYCKSFLLNEKEIAGNTVFLEPYSEKKKKILHFNNKRKTPAKNRAQDYKYKKQRLNSN